MGEVVGGSRTDIAYLLSISHFLVRTHVIVYILSARDYIL